MITFEDFQKLELVVGKVASAERVEGSEKLIRLKIDISEVGPEALPVRQIIAGVGKAYAPEDLVGKEIVIVANLEPRRLMGLESEGMLLAADGGEPVLLIPEKPVKPGSKIR